MKWCWEESSGWSVSTVIQDSLMVAYSWTCPMNSVSAGFYERIVITEVFKSFKTITLILPMCPSTSFAQLHPVDASYISFLMDCSWSLSPGHFSLSFFFISCHSETSHAVLELIAHSLWTIYLLDLCFWVTVWLASPLWGNSFVLVYNWLPSCFIWLNSISQEVLGYLAFFTSFNRCFRTFGSLSLWNEVTKEKCPLWHHHNSSN